jgi:hypothetical protein
MNSSVLVAAPATAAQPAGPQLLVLRHASLLQIPHLTPPNPSPPARRHGRFRRLVPELGRSHGRCPPQGLGALRGGSAAV